MKKMLLIIVASLLACGTAAFADWQGNYNVCMVQASSDGNVFFKICNADGTTNNQNPYVTYAGSDVAKGYRDVLLTAFNSGQKVKLFISEVQPNGWNVVTNIQVGKTGF